MEHTADRVAILRQGHPVVISGLAELKAQALRKIELYFSAPVSPQEFSRLPSVRGVRAENSMLELVVEGMVDDIIKVASRYRVENVISREQDLEEVFDYLLEPTGMTFMQFMEKGNQGIEPIEYRNYEKAGSIP